MKGVANVFLYMLKFDFSLDFNHHKFVVTDNPNRDGLFSKVIDMLQALIDLWNDYQCHAKRNCRALAFRELEP